MYPQESSKLMYPPVPPPTPINFFGYKSVLTSLQLTSSSM
jgi:hypothetical protein